MLEDYNGQDVFRGIRDLENGIKKMISRFNTWRWISFTFFGKPIEINFSKMKKTSDQILQNSKYTIVFKYRPVFYQFYQTLNMYMKKLVLWKLIQFYKQRKAVTSLYPVNHIALNVFVCK